MKPVFPDTVGLIALWDKSDQWHTAASAAYRKLPAGFPAITTTFVLLECGNAATRKPYRSAVDDLRLQLVQKNRLVFPTDTDWNTAWQAYRAGDANSAGIVDQVSFVVMRRFGLTDTFTNDQHFRAAGFTTLF
jgi:predicted nucleic acid-binding protein